MNTEQTLSLITKAGENALQAIEELKLLVAVPDLSESTEKMGEGVLEVSEEFYREINSKYVNGEVSVEQAVDGLMLLVQQASFASGIIVNSSNIAKLTWMTIMFKRSF